MRTTSTIYSDAARILRSDATTLEGLAAIVGLTALELFAGASFDGVDLRDEKIDLLLSIDADYAGAILTRPQKHALDARRETQTRDRLFASIDSMRRRLLRDYIRKHIRSERRDEARAAFLDPPRLPDGRKDAPPRYRIAPSALAFVVAEDDDLLRPQGEALRTLLALFGSTGVPLDRGVVAALEGSEVEFSPQIVEEIIDLDTCTSAFVEEWLASLWEGPERGHTTMQAYQAQPFVHAQVLALTKRTKLTRPYLQMVLQHTTWAKLMEWLIGHVPEEAMSREVVSALAQSLARVATTTKAIRDTALNPDIDRRVRLAFRNLILAARTPEGRTSLMQIIAETGADASGLEVDAILADLSFEEADRIVRTHFDRLSPHHRNVALDAMTKKATGSAQRGRLDVMRRRAREADRGTQRGTS